jgi:DNA (cytosine-5)-methyltransferase 1
MPTPKALDGVKGNLKTSQERLDSGHQVDLPNVVIDLVDSGGGSCCQPQQLQIGKAQTCQEVDQPAVAESPRLLPTTRRSMGNASQPEVDAGDPKKRIENTVLLGDINWGKFAPAIERWETVIGRTAPAPTKPDGKDGSHRLSAEFTEWMMGLPAGWVTDSDLGLSRNEQLKLCGNGVVPQQAALALRMLLEGIEIQ